MVIVLDILCTCVVTLMIVVALTSVVTLKSVTALSRVVNIIIIILVLNFIVDCVYFVFF